MRTIEFVARSATLSQHSMTRNVPENRFRHLFEQIDDPVVEFELVDDEPIVRTLNPAFEDVFGYDHQSMIGQSLDAFILPSDASETPARLDERTVDGASSHQVVTRVTADGPREFLYRDVPYERDGQTFGFGMYTDITRRRRREEKLRAQKQRFKEFAEMISHDIRNPLNVAKGHTEVADPDQAEVILRNLDRIDSIIEDVLTVARSGQPIEQTEQVELSSIATTCWSHVDTAEATLRIVDDFTIQAEPGRLKQLFENLFRNAVEHGGTDVTVTVGGCGPDGFYLADNGSGIQDADRDAVFSRGYSTSANGTGLGLSIVHSICDAHGWSVTLTESDSGGVRFEITGVETEMLLNCS